MRSLAVVGVLLCGAAMIRGDAGLPNLNGNWKVDPARSEASEANKALSLEIGGNPDDIHIKEIRGPNAKDVSEFTCATFGKDCPMRDGGDKATVSAFYNGYELVVLKTHGRRGSSVEKQRFTLSSTGDLLTVEITHIVPNGKPEKLVMTKAQ